ncbi:MAG: hypothetical protein JSV49_06275 [Thermoplasmata archaeon]|nr:MAG: hypothetical protein JSV49_06275 [Thermoplasmata archaeon]
MSITGYSSLFAGQGEANVIVNEFKSGGSHSVTFPVGGGSDNESVIVLPIDANVQDATMDIIAEPSNGQFPLHVELDVGEDGVMEWKFDEIGGGAMGFQRSFWNGVNNTPMNMGTITSNTTLGFRLPKDVDVTSATMQIWAEEQDYLGPVIELNLPGGGLAGPYDDVHDYDPQLIVFKNTLIDIFRSHSDMITNATDGDLVINYTQDGKTWLGLNEVTKDPDGEWPWIIPRERWWGMDMRPSMAIYDDGSGERLYVAWECNSTKTGPYPITGNPPSSEDDEGVSSGYDKDIVITSSANGYFWSNSNVNSYVEITPPDVEDGNTSGKSGYNKANPIPQDWLPQLAVFKDRLYAVWCTNNTESGPQEFGGSDIMVTWSTSPQTQAGWDNVNRVINLTDGDAWNGSDFNPKTVVFKDKLFVFWQTNDTSRGNGSDYDILYRYTSDGDTWSGTRQFSPRGLDDYTEAYLKGDYHLEFWDMTPHPIVFGGKLGIAWETENYRYSYNRTWDQPIDNEQDADIVIAWSTDGITWDLESGTNVFEITPPENDWGDHYPHLCTLDPDGSGPQPERVYCAWNSNDQGTSIWDYDIFYSYSTDGENWVPQRFGSMQPDHGGGDYWAHLASFKGWLYITWWSYDDKDGERSGMYADGDDADVLVRRIVPSYMPATQVSVDVGDDGTFEFPAGDLDNTVKTIDITNALNKHIDSTGPAYHIGEYGIYYEEIPIEVNSPDVPCRIWLANINITYINTQDNKFSMTVPDFSYALNEYIRIHKNSADAADGFLEIPVKISAASAGKLTLTNVDVEYNRIPTITITNPGDTPAFAKETFTISWIAEDPDDPGALISLFYDSDNIPGDETAIDTTGTTMTVGSGGPMSFEWDTSLLPLGKVCYIKAVIDDGIDSAYAYSKNPVKVTRDNVPPSITITSPVTNVDTEYDWLVEWIDSDEDSDAWISLYYDTNTDPNDGKTFIVDGIRENDGADQYRWVIGDDVGIGKYYIYALIEDEENSSYAYSQGYINVIPPSLGPPLDVRISNNLDATGTYLKTHDLQPKLSWSNNPDNPLPDEVNQIGKYKYIINVGTSTENTNDIVMNHEIDVTSFTIASNLEYGNTYHFEVKVTDGKGHYSSSTRRTFDIVNNKPGGPDAKITPEEPTTKSTLKVSIVNESVDPDGDIVEYDYQWYKNNELVEGLTTTTLSPNETKKDDTWSVRITPWDKVGNERQIAGDTTSVTVTIANAAPEPRIASPTNGGKYTQGTAIKFIAEGIDYERGIDPDLDDTDSSLEYRWKSSVDGGIGTEQDFTKDDLSVGIHTITLNVSDGEKYAAQTVTIEILKGEAEEKDKDDEKLISTTAAVGLSALIIVIIIVAVLVLLFLRRKRKEEEPMYPELDQPVMEEELPAAPSAEQLYGEDMPGGPGAGAPLPPPEGVPPPGLPPGEGEPPAGGAEAAPAPMPPDQAESPPVAAVPAAPVEGAPAAAVPVPGEPPAPTPGEETPQLPPPAQEQPQKVEPEQ